MVSVLVFGMPISKAFNKNSHYNSIFSLHQLEEINNIKTYSIKETTPEMLWNYNGKIPNIYKNDLLKIPNEVTFGLLIMAEDVESISKLLSENYNLNFIETYNLNVGSREKERLIREFYLVSKK